VQERCCRRCFERRSCSLLAKVLAKILYRLPKSVIGRQFPILAWSPDLGIKVMRPLLVHSDVSPLLSIAEKAWSSVGEISSTNSWKHSVGMPSLPGVLPLGMAVMASLISFKVRSFVSSSLAKSETQDEVLSQQSSLASNVPGASASKVYSRS
jgi:hypothetical protein